jgi:plastocyanin
MGGRDCAAVRTFAFLSAAAAAFLLSGCSGPEGEPDVAPAQEHLIAIHATDFHPGMITIAEGDALRFENHEGVAHTATAKSSPMGDLDSGDIAPGTDHVFADLEAGTYAFTCRHHANMRLTVSVVAT